jgi:GTP-binding protein
MGIDFNDFLFEKCVGFSKDLPKKTGFEAAFSGRSNVGKSSLINALLKKKVARVSKSAGKTATINFYSNGSIRLVDLPGYGFAKASPDEKKRWSELTENYFRIRSPNFVCQLIDLRLELQRSDAQMILFMQKENIPFIIICTKSDKLGKKEREKMQAILKNQTRCEDLLFFSSLNGEGANELRNILHLRFFS